MERSRRFIADCQAEAPMVAVPKAFDSYEAMLASDDVDAVYIPLPTGVRGQWVLRAAEAGKHVNCEKPCAISVAELEEILAACRSSGVQFMDDVMFVHSSRFKRLREVLDDGQSVGPVRRMASAFSFPGSPEFFAENIRLHSELEPLGCLGDLGWYCIRFFLWTMNWQMPIRASGRMLSEGGQPGSPAKVPTAFSGELLFEGGVSAAFYCSFITHHEQWAIVSGANGLLQLSDFVLPFVGEGAEFQIRKSDYVVKGCDFRMDTSQKIISVPEWSHGHPNAQEVNCFRNFAEQVQSGTLSESWPEAALTTQKVMCACLDDARAQG